MRGTDVVSDPTNVLALECARRLKTAPQTPVRLCAAHQVLRMQPIKSAEGVSKHFRLFALADAGPGLPNDGFEVAAVVAQLGVYRRLLEAATQARGLVWSRPTVIIRSNSRLPAIAERVASALRIAQPDVEPRVEVLESAYYDGLRIGYAVHDRHGAPREWVDLGAFDWVAQTLGNWRQRFISSAIGIQLLPLLSTKNA